MSIARRHVYCAGMGVPVLAMTGGRLEHRRANTRAIDMPSAMPRYSRCRAPRWPQQRTADRRRQLAAHTTLSPSPTVGGATRSCVLCHFAAHTTFSWSKACHQCTRQSMTQLGISTRDASRLALACHARPSCLKSKRHPADEGRMARSCAPCANLSGTACRPWLCIGYISEVLDAGGTRCQAPAATL